MLSRNVFFCANIWYSLLLRIKAKCILWRANKNHFSKSTTQWNGKIMSLKGCFTRPLQTELKCWLNYYEAILIEGQIENANKWVVSRIRESWIIFMNASPQSNHKRIQCELRVLKENTFLRHLLIMMIPKKSGYWGCKTNYFKPKTFIIFLIIFCFLTQLCFVCPRLLIR